MEGNGWGGGSDGLCVWVWLNLAVCAACGTRVCIKTCTIYEVGHVIYHNILCQARTLSCIYQILRALLPDCHKPNGLTYI